MPFTRIENGPASKRQEECLLGWTNTSMEPSAMATCAPCASVPRTLILADGSIPRRDWSEKSTRAAEVAVMVSAGSTVVPSTT